MNLRFVLLALLSNEPNTGYGLGRALNDEVKHLWDTSLQQIYGELQAMQTAGLTEQRIVALSNRRAKKIYSISSRGRSELQQWLAGPAGSQRQKDSFLVKLYCLDQMPLDAVVRHLEERRDASMAEAQELRAKTVAISPADREQMGLLLTLDAALAAAEARARWCDKTLACVRGQSPASLESVQA